MRTRLNGVGILRRFGRAAHRRAEQARRSRADRPLGAMMDNLESRVLLSADPWVQTAKLLAPDGAANDGFTRVAISGNIAVVGAPYADTNGQDAGAAYLYQYVGSTWALLGKLTAADADANSYFGYSVAIDSNTILIGAWGQNSSTGAAYVFQKPAAGWTTTSTPTAKLTIAGGAVQDEFGASVDISGNTAVIGAVGVSNFTGAAYVFVAGAGGWTTTSTPTATLTVAGEPESSTFGKSVSIANDTILVGADAENQVGAAYIYLKPGGGWTTTGTPNAKLSDSLAGQFGHFGLNVALSEDASVAVIERENSINTNNVVIPGGAHVFVRPAGGWTSSSTPAAVLATGAVAISGDTIVVGTNLYQRPAGGWTAMAPTASVAPAAIAAADLPGRYVAIDGPTVLEAVPGDDTHGENAGAVYAFQVNGVPDVGVQRAAYVRHLYADLLGRDVDETGLVNWVNTLEVQPNRVVAEAIINSTEYRTVRVKEVYRQLLRREADPTGVDYWVSRLAAGDSIVAVSTDIMKSDEYYTRIAGGTNTGYVTYVYSDLLGRGTDPNAAYWVDQLNAGADRAGISNQLNSSTEYRQIVVRYDYARFLGRPAEPAGVDYWVGQLASGARVEDILISILGSDEYFNNS